MNYADVLQALTDHGVTAVEWEIKDITRRQHRNRVFKPTGRGRFLFAERVGRWVKRLDLSQIGGYA